MFAWLRKAVSYVFGGVLRVRHWLYDNGYFKSYTADVPTICVGNLAVGGTGKSPIVAALMERFGTRHGAVMLSRGYGRTTRGFRVVRPSSSALEVGDEPLQLKLRTPENRVVVCEDRVAGCRQILQEYPDCELIVLDDAFQHRRLRSSVNLLLTRFDNPFSTDFLLPYGRLRDLKCRARYADAIVVTNVPAQASRTECEQLAKQLQSCPEQPVLFSGLCYGEPRNLTGELFEYSTLQGNVYGLAGIANPASFFEYIATLHEIRDYLTYNDHHRFTRREITLLERIVTHDGWIITTEKDATRLRELVAPESYLSHRILYIPIHIVWLWESEKKLERILKNELEKN